MIEVLSGESYNIHTVRGKPFLYFLNYNVVIPKQKQTTKDNILLCVGVLSCVFKTLHTT